MKTEPPRWKCPVHGEITPVMTQLPPERVGGVQYCKQCLAEWLVDSFPVKQIKEQPK
jgi:hypothetical protein